MTTDVFDFLHNESPVGLFADVVEQLRYRGEVPSGEDVMVDEAGFPVSKYRLLEYRHSLFALGVRFVSSFGHGDALKDGNSPVWFQQAINTREICGEKLLTDGLQHLDGHDLVV